MSLRPYPLICGLAATLLLGCNQPDTTASAPETPAPSAPRETSSPAPSSTPAPPAPLEVNSFTLDELIEKAGRGCSILLTESPDDTDYIYHERIQADGYGPALMKIEGGWVNFVPTAPASDAEVNRFFEAPRFFESEDGDFTLIADTPLGERTGYEVSEIPNATLEIQYRDELATTVAAVGESGC